MHFGLSEEQVELARSVRGLVERRASRTDLRAAMASDAGHDVELWQDLCGQIGVAALAVPEEFGGVGFSSFETHVALETLGASLTPSPLLGSTILGTRAVLLAGSPDDCARILPDVAEGSRSLALVWADSRGRWRTDGSDVSATATAEGWRLEGTAGLVLDAVHADLLLVVATTPTGPRLFEVAPDAAGVRITPTPALDQTLALSDVAFSATPAQALSGTGNEAAGAVESLRRLRAEAAVAVTALQVGGAQAALERTVAHLAEREQFGRPLGSFQALKHRAADMMVQVETARSVSWAAAWAAATGPATDVESLEQSAATAKSWCSEAFSAVAGEMVQLHGGIAITWEHDAHLFFKRAHATSILFGSAREHRRLLVEA